MKQASKRPAAAAARDSRETERATEIERQMRLRQREFETSDRDEIFLHFYNIDPGYLQNSV